MLKGSTHLTLVNTNGLYHQPNYQNKNKGCPQCYLHRLNGRAATSLFMVNGLNNVPIAEKVCNEGDRIRRPTISAEQSVSWSTRIEGDTGIETGMVCEEGHDDVLIQKNEGGFGILSNVPELPPWGDVQSQDGNGIESIEDDFHVDFEDLHSTLEPKLHFLEERDEEILSNRILELSRSNKVRSALELYISMEASCLQPSTRACNSLLSCLLRNGFLNNALRVFDTMKKETTSGHTYSLILKAVAKARGCDTALKMFMELERKGLVHIFDVITYNTMISICAKVNNWVQAERVWKSLKENDHRATTITYDLLVSTFVRCGQSELAFNAYSEMVQNGLKPSGDMMQALISTCVKEGKWGLAHSVFQSMLKSGLNPNIVAYNALINSIGKAGEVELCFKVFGLMKNSGHTPDAYTWNALLGALNRGNRHMDTLRLFESIKRKKSIQLNAHLYNTALLSCQRLGSWDRSLQILWQMEASDIPISTESYNLVLGSCEAARKPKVALQVYEQMVHKKCIPDTFTYLSLIRSCSWGSLWSEVKEILDHVPPDVSLYNAVIHGMCLRGNISLAKKMYMKMCEIGLKPDGKTRALMIQNLRKNSITKNNRYPSHQHHHYA